MDEGRGPSSPRRVLAVDDEECIINVYERLLRRHTELSVARSGAEALSVLREHPFDVLIIDQRLRGELGTDMAATARASWPGLRIILVTADTADVNVEDAIRRGVIDVAVSKPFDPGQLRLEVLRVD